MAEEMISCPKDEILQKFVESSDFAEFVDSFFNWREYVISGPQIFAAFSKKIADAGDEKDKWLLKITKLCKKWVETRPMDFFYEENLLQQFLDWIAKTEQTYNTSTKPTIHKMFQHCLITIEKQKKNFISFEVEQRRVKNTYEDYLVLPKADKPENKIDFSKVDITKLDPTEFAEELFIKHYKLIANIPTREFLFQRWTKSDKLQCAPNIVYCMQQLNAFTQWISTQVLNGIKAQDQSDRMRIVIDIASASLSVRDYHSLLNIISTLNTSSMSKLKNAWSLLPERTLKKWEDICSVMNPLGNWKYYRAVIKDQSRPYVPFLGVILTDMLMVDQGNDTYTPEGTVNLRKMDLINQSLECLFHFRKFSIAYKPKPAYAFVHHLEVNTTDDELYRLAQLRVLAQNCANKRRCVIKGEFIIDVDTITQLSPKTEGHTVYIAWDHADVINKRSSRFGSKKGESARALCMQQTACWSSALSEDGASSARISFVTTVTQDAKTLAFKRKEIVLTLRKEHRGKSSAIAKAVINIADYADHKTDVRKRIPLQSKLPLPPLMDIRIRTIWRKYNGKKLISSDAPDSLDVSSRETLEVGGLQYLLMTDTEATDDGDLTDSSIGDSDSEALGDESFAPIPELNLDGLTVEQLQAQLTDVRNQFRHMKQQFGRVLTQKEELQRTIDSQALQLKSRETAKEATSTDAALQRMDLLPDSPRKATRRGSKQGKAVKKAAKERLLLQKYYNWIPFSSTVQLEKLSLLAVKAEPCSSGDAEMLIDQSQDLVQETFRSLLGWACFVDSGARSPFLQDLVTVLKVCFVRTCEKLDCNCIWLNTICALLSHIQDEKNLCTKGDLHETGINSCPYALIKDESSKQKTPADLTPVEWLESQLYQLIGEIMESILHGTVQKLERSFEELKLVKEIPQDIAATWRKALSEMITYTKGFPCIANSIIVQLVECCLTFISRKMINWLLVTPKLCSGNSGIAIKYSLRQVLDWAAAATSVDKESFEDCVGELLQSVNLLFCITNPAVFENGDFLPNVFQIIAPAQVYRIAVNMGKYSTVSDSVLIEIAKHLDEEQEQKCQPLPHTTRDILNHIISAKRTTFS